MTKVVKCNSCNIVLDELLSYIQNKVSVIDEDTLTRICVSSFTKEEIEKSKSLLFDSIGTSKGNIKRKNKGKEERDLADIVNIFKSTEPDLIPIFCARNLEKLPPILFDHLDCTKLLKDLLRVQNEVKEIQSLYVTQRELGDFKENLLSQIRNDSVVPLPASVCKVNIRRGGWVEDSGPIGLSHIPNSLINESFNIVSDDRDTNNLNQYRDIKRVEYENNDNGRQQLSSETDYTNGAAVTESRSAARQLVSVTSPQIHNMNSDSACGAFGRGIAQTANKQEMQPINKLESRDTDEGWQQVSYRRKHKPNYRYLGSAGTNHDSEGRFKAAERMVPIFITKVHKDTNDKDIIDYVYKQTQEMITLEKISFKQERGYDAYKFFVKDNKVSVFLNSVCFV